jgi:hypothetical protein
MGWAAENVCATFKEAEPLHNRCGHAFATPACKRRRIQQDWADLLFQRKGDGT